MKSVLFAFASICAVFDNPPPAFAVLETAPITQNQVVDIAGIDDAIRTFF